MLVRRGLRELVASEARRQQLANDTAALEALRRVAAGARLPDTRYEGYLALFFQNPHNLRPHTLLALGHIH